jgi:hypothetical protein
LSRPRVQPRGARLPTTSFIRYFYLLRRATRSLLRVSRRCLERVPAALLPRGRIGVYLGKMAIWAHSPHSPIRCLPPLLCTFLLTWWLTCALSRCFGRWRDRDRNLFLLKMVVNGPVNDRQLDAGCAFCARLSSSTLRPSAAQPTAPAIGCRPRRRSTSAFAFAAHIFARA